MFWTDEINIVVEWVEKPRKEVFSELRFDVFNEMFLKRSLKVETFSHEVFPFSERCAAGQEYLWFFVDKIIKLWKVLFPKSKGDKSFKQNFDFLGIKVKFFMLAAPLFDKIYDICFKL